MRQEYWHIFSVRMILNLHPRIRNSRLAFISPSCTLSVSGSMENFSRVWSFALCSWPHDLVHLKKILYLFFFFLEDSSHIPKQGKQVKELFTFWCFPFLLVWSFYLLTKSYYHLWICGQIFHCDLTHLGRIWSTTEPRNVEGPSDQDRVFMVSLFVVFEFSLLSLSELLLCQKTLSFQSVIINWAFPLLISFLCDLQKFEFSVFIHRPD